MLYSEISFLMQVLCGLNQLLFPFRGWALLCSWQFTGMKACPLFVFQVPGAAGLNRERFCFVRTYRTVSAYKLLWEEVEGLGLFSSPRPLDVDHILPLSTGCLLSEYFQNPSAKTSKLMYIANTHLNSESMLSICTPVLLKKQLYSLIQIDVIKLYY